MTDKPKIKTLKHKRNQTRYDTVAIIGVGLIGGSIALDLKSRGIARRVVGVFRRESTLRKALARHMVDHGTRNIREGVKDADVVIIASPVPLIPLLGARSIPFMKRGALLMDAGSVKESIVGSLTPVAEKHGVSFIGAHPMAGSEKSGPESAKKGLFEDSIVFISPAASSPTREIARAEKFWRAIGARTVTVSARAHDREVAVTSHLPHLAACALCRVAASSKKHFFAGGFRDSTRIAASDPGIWSGIFVENSENLIRAVKSMKEELSGYEALLKKKDLRSLAVKSGAARKIRASL